MSQYITQSTLLRRGWTGKIIKMLLPAPDKTAPNPHYSTSGAEMKLYLLTRVEGIEASADFQIARQAAEHRKVAAAKSLDTKRQRLADYVNSISVVVPVMDMHQLTRLACDNYNENRLDGGDVHEDKEDGFRPATPQSDAGFLRRITVNYLRHCASEYEDYLDSVFGRVGTDDAQSRIRSKVYHAIAGAYPWLGRECKKQQARREEQQARRDNLRTDKSHGLPGNTAPQGLV